MMSSKLTAKITKKLESFVFRNSNIATSVSNIEKKKSKNYMVLNVLN